jgi:hypothetical protein
MTSLTKETPSVTRCVSLCSVGCFGLYSLQLSKGYLLDFHGSWNAWLWMLLLLHASLDPPLACARARAHTHTHTNTQTHKLSLSLCYISFYLEILPRASRIFAIQHAVRWNKFCLLFCMGVKLGRWHWGRKTGWGCLRIGCWKEYLVLRGTR